MTPEGKIKAKVKARFAKEFKQCYRFMPVQNGMGAAALDILFCIFGRFVAIETKAEPKPGHSAPKPTPRQQTTMQEITDAGGIALLVYDDETLDRAVVDIKTALWLSGVKVWK